MLFYNSKYYTKYSGSFLLLLRYLYRLNHERDCIYSIANITIQPKVEHTLLDSAYGVYCNGLYIGLFVCNKIGNHTWNHRFYLYNHACKQLTPNSKYFDIVGLLGLDIINQAADNYGE